MCRRCVRQSRAELAIAPVNLLNKDDEGRASFNPERDFVCDQAAPNTPAPASFIKSAALKATSGDQIRYSSSDPPGGYRATRLWVPHLDTVTEWCFSFRNVFGKDYSAVLLVGIVLSSTIFR